MKLSLFSTVLAFGCLLIASVSAQAPSGEGRGNPFASLLAHAIDEDEYHDLKSNRKTLEKTDEEAIEFTPIFSFLRSQPKDRHLLESCETGDHSERCAAVLAAGFFGLNGDDAGVYSSCGALTNEKEGGFCLDEESGTKLCCGSALDDCCTLNVGALVGAIIGGIFVLAVSIFGCCFCCSCCCMYDKLHGNNTGNSGEVVVVKPNEAPSPEKTVEG